MLEMQIVCFALTNLNIGIRTNIFFLHFSNVAIVLKHHIAADGNDKLRYAVAPAIEAQRRVIRQPTEKSDAEGARKCGHNDAVYADEGHQQSVSIDGSGLF